MIMRKHAFTLAEVLITLGVIGVVTAITMPLIMKNVQKYVLKNQFKKSYNTLSQAIQKTYSDSGYSLICVYEGGGGPKADDCVEFHEQLRKNLKIIKTCNGNAKRDGCIKDIKGQSSPAYWTQNNIDTSNTVYILQDGTSIMLYGNGGNAPIFIVDVNGTKSPNKWGYDIFGFYNSKYTLKCYMAYVEDGGSKCSDLILKP